jgi:hypothetical protein
MLRVTKEWDVRCPQALADLFPTRKGYYFKVDRRTAQEICDILSEEYGVSRPVVSTAMPEVGCLGQYGCRIIWVHSRSHLKAVFHEWYHHLDSATFGKYNSDDRSGGRSSLAWQFAEKLFDKFRVTKAQV